MERGALINLIRSICGSEGVDPELAIAIADKETGIDSGKTRFEDEWSYFLTPDKFAMKLGITEKTEKTLQAISWNAMQVMGTVARELGLNGQLTLLVNPSIGVLYGVRKLKALSKKYKDELDVIAAYNAGHPIKLADGTYKNQAYVSGVMERLSRARLIKGR